MATYDLSLADGVHRLPNPCCFPRDHRGPWTRARYIRARISGIRMNEPQTHARLAKCGRASCAHGIACRSACRLLWRSAEGALGSTTDRHTTAIEINGRAA